MCNNVHTVREPQQAQCYLFSVLRSNATLNLDYLLPAATAEYSNSNSYIATSKTSTTILTTEQCRAQYSGWTHNTTQLKESRTPHIAPNAELRKAILSRYLPTPHYVSMPPNVRTHPFAIRFILFLFYFIFSYFGFISFLPPRDAIRSYSHSFISPSYLN
jgi:hypothetical protein